MRSRTKRSLDASERGELVRESFGPRARVVAWDELTDGQFNAAYRVRVEREDGTVGVVIKIAPRPGTPLLTYERDLMHTEALFYTRVGGAEVPLPALLHAGLDRQVLDSDYLVIAALDGEPLNRATPHLPDTHRRALRAELGRHVAAIHRHPGETFGYPQAATGLQRDTWPEAFTAMVDAVLADAARFGVALPLDPPAIAAAVRDHADVLGAVSTPVLTHFDLWDGNVFVTRDDPPRIEGLIDPERAFWGDPHADLVSLTLFGELREEDPFVAGYRAAGGQLTFDRSLRRRLHLYRAYLDLIMLVEPTPRGYGETATARIRAFAGAHLTRELRALDREREA